MTDTLQSREQVLIAEINELKCSNRVLARRLLAAMAALEVILEDKIEGGSLPKDVAEFVLAEIGNDLPEILP